jgi:predicted enzyme related to lactoylglutathione lyase
MILMDDLLKGVCSSLVKQLFGESANVGSQPGWRRGTLQTEIIQWRLRLKTRIKWLCVLLLSLTACTAVQFNVPAVTEGQGVQLPGKIVWHDLLTDTPKETEAFYTGLFGWQFEPLAGANYQLIRHHGKLIGGMIDQNRLPTEADVSQWVVVLAVSDIEQAVRELAAAGGHVFTPPTSLGDRGDIAVVADAQGAVLALLQTGSGEPADDDGPAATGDFLWDELWAEDISAAADFYSRLAPYEAEALTLGDATTGSPYRLLKTNDQVRAGIRDNPVDGLDTMWVSYLRVADAASLQDILSRVDALGGKILVPATPRPGGGEVALIAGPSGAGIALQTWSDEQKIATTAEKQL